MPIRNRQRGNILFLILLAIVLFAALSYAVTSSTRGGGKDASSEKVDTFAAQIVQQSTMMENAAGRMRLVNGCKDAEFSFENGTTAADYVNSGTPVDGRCKLFAPTGGGVTYLKPDTAMLDPAFSAQAIYGEWFFNATCIPQIGSADNNGCPSNASKAITAILPYVRRDICDRLNTITGHSSTPGDNNGIYNNTAFKGAFSGSYILSDYSSTGTGCICATSSTAAHTPDGSCHYYRPLVIR